MNQQPDSIADDIEAVGRLSAVPSILEVICSSTGLRFAAVARVTDSRWVACAVRDEIEFGLKPGDELELKTTICDEIRQSGQAVIIDHVDAITRWRDHHTPRQYGFQSYISMPIFRANGDFFGTLCALDPEPAKLDEPRIVKSFELFSQLIGLQLDAEERHQHSRELLAKEQETAKLRDQFIAVLGHDLRTPLSVVMSGAEVLLRLPLPAKAREIAERMLRSADRMARLVDNMLDFARGKLGSGINISLEAGDRLRQALSHVVSELASVHTDRSIEFEIDLQEAVHCDPGRIAQLLSNLLSNALSHGAKDTPVTVRARSAQGCFTLSVGNQGEAISEQAFTDLFLPFTRFNGGGRSPGLGLGLYIASQIAAAHFGSIEVESTDEQTVFTLTMPTVPPKAS